MVEVGGHRISPAIDLASVAGFSLGNVHVQPARRLLVLPDGSSRELEPRVMKVLIALASAQGAVVSRDRLAELCWDGRIVGEDALNRCIQGLRRLSREADPPSFTIETVPRVGYCLTSDPLPQVSFSAHPDDTAPSPRAVAGAGATRGSGPGRTILHRPVVRVVAGAFLLLLFLAVGLWVTRGYAADSTSAHRIAVLADKPDASSYARDLSVDLARLAGAHADDMSVVADRDDADLLVMVSFSRIGNLARANLTLERKESAVVLWSGLVELPVQQVESVRPQLAGKLGNVLICALALPRAGTTIDHTSAKLFVAACEQADLAPAEQQLIQLGQVTKEAPGFAPAWGLLALVGAELHAMQGWGAPAPGTASAPPDQIVRQIAQARKLDATLGDTYAAEAALLAPGQRAQRIALLEQGLELDPENARLHERLSVALFDVGRITDAVNAAAKAAALRPLSSRSRATLIVTLAHAGNMQGARRELADAQRMWPDSEDIRRARFSLELRYGDPRVAQQMMDRAEANLGGPTGGFGGPEVLMRARLDPTPENVARMVHFVSRQTRKVPSAVPLRLQALGHANAVDEAYRMMDQPGVMQSLAGATAILFRPHLKGFRYDPRFMLLSRKMGLLDYWQARNVWPDFCADPGLPYDCRDEARRLRGSEQPAGRTGSS